MKESAHNESVSSIPTDADTHSEMVELIAHRRPREEARRSSRFPTSETLSGDFVSPVPFGLIVCDNQSAHEVRNAASVSESIPSTPRPREREVLEIISGFHVVDFSGVGMQIQFACGNPFKYSRKQLCLRIADSTIPAAMQWFYENNGMVRAGVSFQEDIKQSPTLSGILVELSDRLINFLTHHYIADNSLHCKEIAVFAYFCILSNLRLKYIRALSIFNKTNRELESYAMSNTQSYEITKAIRNYCYSMQLQLHSTTIITEAQEYKNAFEIFMKPYYEFGCSISGAEGRLVFLEKEVVDIVSNCLIFPATATPHSKILISQLQGVYECFTTLQELLPVLFQSEKITQQFKHYNSLIRSIALSREALIDFYIRSH